ncbi:sporulation protein YqfD [Sporolactobacillus shoreae]|uniref:Sporulation protein YqfD n=1 Tax=Sporolactobacillus shoreae TaxID=1465501 RepID=A0A4Z0GQQ7_9BACL|nr:sporulation protein YqfD [Sporolactobacillus shoreae]TGA99583.1 sporulation protein YqfD [Sporolactobacillus shoreae]
MRHWTGQAGGYLKAEITGNAPEKFLTLCAASDIRFWQVKRKNKNTLICFLTIKRPDQLKALLRESGCTIRIVNKKGFPFYWRKLKTRSGIIFGLFFFIAVLFILSNMVWAVQVSGADPKLEDEIRSILVKEHLYVGTLNFFVPDSGQLESRLSSQLNTVTWIGVSQEGTTYKVDVVQKKYPKQDDKPTGPRNLVAAKQAIIHSLFVETGQPVVESNQYVKKGQVLVLGKIGTDESPQFVSANGKVIGETWYQSQTVIPLKSRYSFYTGKSSTVHRLQIGPVSIPLWGLSQHPYRQFDKEIVRKPIRFLLWDLPVSYVRTQFREKNVSIRTLTQKEALEEAGKASEQKLMGSLPAESEIVSSSVESEKLEKGKLTVLSREIVYENIAQPQVIDLSREKKKSVSKQKAGR